MVSASTKMETSWLVSLMRKLDRLDMAVGVAIGILLIAIIVVSSVGQQVKPRIVYLAPVDNLIQNLYAVEVGKPQKEARQLTDSQGGVRDFGVSSDGKYIAYSETQDNGSIRLMLYEVSSGKTSVLQSCDDAICSNPAFRPDNRVVAYERTNLNKDINALPGVPRVWLVDITTGNSQPLFTDSQQLGYSPRWSPDGHLLAVVNYNALGISVHNFTTGEDKTIPSVQGENGQFSPDSKWMLFPKVITLPDGAYVTHYVLVDLTSPFYVQSDLLSSNDPTDEKEAIWSPDSKHLIVARPAPGTAGLAAPQIYNVDVATTQATTVINDTNYSHGSLSLSPTGKMLLFQRFPLNKPGGRLEIWTYNFETHEIIRVAENATFAKWLP